MPKVPTIAELRARWDDADAAVSGLALLGGLTVPTPFGDVNGRVDLRGLRIDRGSSVAVMAMRAPGLGLQADGHTVRFKEAVWRGLDLTHAVLGDRALDGCTITDCVLDRADLAFAILWRTTIERSSLVGANLNHVQVLPEVGGGRRSVLREVDLSRAKLSRASFTDADLIGCDFTAARAPGVEFSCCGIGETRFVDARLGAGRFLNLAVPATDLSPATTPRWMVDVDFTGADLRGVAFDGCRLRGVRFDADVIVATPGPRVARTLLDLLPAGEDPTQPDGGLRDQVFREFLTDEVSPAYPADSSLVVLGSFWEGLDAEGWPAYPGYVDRLRDLVAQSAGRHRVVT